MVRPPLVIGSHKLFLPPSMVAAFGHELTERLTGRTFAVEAVVSPSLVNLASLTHVLNDLHLGVAAQDFHQDQCGAFTGQVALDELLELHVRYVMLGHHEVLRYQRTEPASIARKVTTCLRRGLVPIVFWPHPADDPDEGHADELIAHRARALLDDAAANDMPLGDVVVVYEPASPPARADDVLDVASWCELVRHRVAVIRRGVTSLGQGAASIRVLYGGGVTAASIGRLSELLGIDGVLVGRPSVQAGSFVQILEAAHQVAVSRQCARLNLESPSATSVPAGDGSSR